MLQSMPIGGAPEPGQAHHAWLRPAVLSREELRDAALLFKQPDGSFLAFKVLICFQNPYEVLSQPLQAIETEGPTAEGEVPDQTDRFAHKYTYDPSSVCDWKSMPNTPLEAVYVLKYVFYRPGSKAVSAAKPVPLKDVYLDREIKVKVKDEGEEETRKAEKAVAAAITPALLAEHPWLESYLPKKEAEDRPPPQHKAYRGDPTAPEGSSEDEESGEDDESAKSDMELEGFFHDLEQVRGMEKEEENVKLKDFRAAERGGTGTFNKYGQYYDAWQGQVQRDSAAQE
eukprot:9324530-Lingulodinium_polyedra.AAC.1